MGNIDKIKINADEQLLKTVMTKFNEFMSAYHAVGKEILQPDMFDDVQVEAKPKGISNGLAFKDYFALEESKSKIREGVAGAKKCWPGHRKVGTQPGTGKNAGKRVNDCKKIKEGEDTTMEEGFGDTITRGLRRAANAINPGAITNAGDSNGNWDKNTNEPRNNFINWIILKNLDDYEDELLGYFDKFVDSGGSDLKAGEQAVNTWKQKMKNGNAGVAEGKDKKKGGKTVDNCVPTGKK
jgi:hypothetical protein